jgi:hypothetical protein
MKISKLQHAIEKSPYLKDFRIMGQSTRHRRNKLLDLFLDWLSGNNPHAFLEDYLIKTPFGHMYSQNRFNNDKFVRMVERIKHVHQTCPTKQRSKILSLLSVVYNRTELRELGVRVSNTQYNSSLNHHNSNFQEISERATRRRNTEIRKCIETFLMESSSESRNSSATGLPVYYVNSNKKQLFQRFKELYPNMKVSLSLFYKSFPKNIKKAIKKTDVCPVCKNTKN